MKWQAIFTLAQVFAFVACASASNSGSPAAPGAVKLNQSFTLKIGASATVEGEGVQVGFESVLSDSRCPKGAQCIVAGDATIRVWMSGASQSRESRELKTTPPDASQTVIGRYRLTLSALTPEPTLDGTPRRSDYVATLVVARLP